MKNITITQKQEYNQNHQKLSKTGKIIEKHKKYQTHENISKLTKSWKKWKIIKNLKKYEKQKKGKISKYRSGKLGWGKPLATRTRTHLKPVKSCGWPPSITTPPNKSGHENEWMNEYGHWNFLFIKLSLVFCQKWMSCSNI